MRIHFFTTRLDLKTGGGSHRHCISLIRLLREMGHDVEVHCLFSTRNVPPPDVIPHTYAGEKLGFRAFHAFVANLMKQHEKDAALFFVSGPPLAFGAGKYRAEGGVVPVAVYLDNYLYSMGKTRDDSQEASFIARVTAFLKELSYRMKRVVYDRTIGLHYARAVDRYFVASPYLGDTYTHFGFPKGRFITAPHFFDAPVSVHPRLYKKSGPVSFMYAGRLTYDKGVDVLISALASLDNHEWVLRIVGNGPQTDRLISLAKKLNVTKQVTFVPWATPEVMEEEYARADVFVHPTRWAEPLGRTIIEAMQRGLPLIVSYTGGPSWAAEGASLTFKNGDVHSLSRALSEIQSDAVKRQMLGEAGIKRAHAFDREVLAPAFKKEITKILSDTVASK